MKRALGLLLIIAVCFVGFLFLVLPADIKGTIGQEIPYLGFPLFLLKSWQGAILVFITISVIAVFLYSKELGISSRRFYRKLINPVIQEYNDANLVLSRRFEATEAALDKFASSMELYSRHLESHTSAIQGLSDASSELKKSAIEQTRVITHILKTMEYKTYREDISRLEGVVREHERKSFGVENTLYKLEKATKMEELKIEADVFPIVDVKSPSGCVLSHKVLLSKKYIHD